MDLIYLDPPFFSQKNYEGFWIKDEVTKLRFSDTDWKELIDQVDPNIIKEYEAIEARWKGGKNGISVYIAYMHERIEQCWRILKNTGSIYLHCDWHASHYLKIMMDDIFGYNNFQNEVIWYKGFRGTPRQTGWQREHDVVLFYSKNSTYAWNKIYGKYKDETMSRYNKVDEHGNRYALIKRRRTDGEVYYGKSYPKGKLHGDVIEIPILASRHRERTNQPTQKPVSLLDKIIHASSNEGDVVLDPFCGCGTTLESASSLKRRWIGIDISRNACDVMKDRLGGNVQVVGCETPDELAVMDPHEFARLIIVTKMGGSINPRKTGDMGIDGWVELMTVPVQVKRWRNRLGRPEIDKFKTAVERDNKQRGIIVASDFTRDAIAEAARIKRAHGIEIELKKVGDIFGWPKYR